MQVMYYLHVQNNDYPYAGTQSESHFMRSGIWFQYQRIWLTVIPVIISHCIPNIHTRVSLNRVCMYLAVWVDSRFRDQSHIFPELMFAFAHRREGAA